MTLPQKGSEIATRKIDVRLPGKGNSNCHSARPVHLIHHQDDKLDSDQWVVNTEPSLYPKTLKRYVPPCREFLLEHEFAENLQLLQSYPRDIDCEEVHVPIRV